ncbi:MAG: DUF3054 domain-containing protein [Ilumatobacteraceae bacterium]
MTSPNMTRRASLRHYMWSAVADVLTVVVFVAIGRRNHDEDASANGVLEVAAPFLVALVLVWLVLSLSLRRRSPVDPVWGLGVWVGTVTLGMVLRKVAFEDGTATAFVIVATIFLGAGLNGWRAIARWALTRRRTAEDSS